jgi:Secretion system C-terminal sorting domain
MVHYGDSLTGGIPNSFYALLEYDSLPANTFDSLGQHWCDCKSTQSISNLQQSNTLVILPNPVTDKQFTVQSVFPIASVQIYSLIGQPVYFRDFTSCQNEIKVLVNSLSMGVYLIKVIYSDNQSVTRKIIIQ